MIITIITSYIVDGYSISFQFMPPFFLANDPVSRHLLINAHHCPPFPEELLLLNPNRTKTYQLAPEKLMANRRVYPIPLGFLIANFQGALNCLLVGYCPVIVTTRIISCLGSGISNSTFICHKKSWEGGQPKQ